MRTLLCLLSLLVCPLVWSQPSGHTNNHQPSGHTNNSQPSCHIYNKVEGGFEVRSADGELLAYSDAGSVDTLQLPPAMADWLASCEQQLSLVREGKAVRHRSARRAANIAPLVTSRWGQSWPFNRMAPEYAPDCHCAAGCLAVAMAQVLRYWHSQTPTLPIPAYTTETLGLWLDELPATTFRYDIMADEYDLFDWGESAQEVARLMRYCGQASEMDYDINSGTYTTGDYLARYFGFRHDYTDKYHVEHMTDWESLLYAELAAGRPMLYSGKKMNGAGHVFVVDGYQDGYFHINWGWSGNSNGYFKITLANADDPDSAYLWEGYRWAQMAVIGLQPDAESAVRSVKADASPATIHDLLGRRVTTPTHGLYIVQGRKVVR